MNLEKEELSRNPLKSGQGFNKNKNKTNKRSVSRNPLKSGQGFNPKGVLFQWDLTSQVVIPLNRVKVSTSDAQVHGGSHASVVIPLNRVKVSTKRSLYSLWGS